MFDFTKERVLRSGHSSCPELTPVPRSVEESLERLGVDYIDVIQVPG
jgi:aryl-alcohol dehydrogenase-like predicted oxidoreductase